MRLMRRWMLAGLVVLGMAGAACEEQGTGSPAPPPGAEPGARLGEELETRAPTGTTVEPGEQPRGGGAAGADEWRGCGATIEEDANALVVVGTLRRTSRAALTLETPEGEEVWLFTDPSTCVLLAGRPIPPESLSEGTQVRASYVLEDGRPTARMVRTQPTTPGL